MLKLKALVQHTMACIYLFSEVMFGIMMIDEQWHIHWELDPI